MSFENYIQYEDGPQFVAEQAKIELVFQDENGCGSSSPFVAVMVNGVQHDKVWAYIDKEQGADGGWYSVVKFRREK
jgi:hypothetical protein